MAQQTAVEWLFHKLWDTPKDKFTWYAILQQAKEMDKEQIKESFILGNAWSIFPEDKDINQIAEQYYKETYGKQ